MRRTLVLGVLLLPLPALGALFLSGEDELVSTTAAVEDDLFVVGAQVDVDEAVRDDVFASGATVTARSEVGGNVFAAGQTVTVRGAVQDDVHAAGATVRISGAVAGDVFAAGNQVFIDRGAVISGGLYTAGGEIVIEGTVEGTVRSAGQQTHITETAVIGGDLLTFGGFPPKIAEGAQVAGALSHHATPGAAAQDPRELLGWWVRSVLGWFILAALLLYVFPHFAQRCVDTILTRGGAALGIGALGLLLGVPLAMVLGAVVIGWPAVVLVVFGTVADVLAGLALAMLAAGVWAARAFTKTQQSMRWQHALVGAVLVKLLQLVPIIGGLVVLVLVLLALGAGWLVIWQTFGRKRHA